MTGSPEWPQDRVDELTRLWVGGMSAGQIAAHMGVTRNAAIGKLHRLGIDKYARANSEPRPGLKPGPKPKAADAPPPSTPRRDALVALARSYAAPNDALKALYACGKAAVRDGSVDLDPAVISEPAIVCEPVTFAQRGDNQCARPLVDRNERGEMLFCGAARDGKSAYCGTCRATMYQPLKAADPVPMPRSRLRKTALMGAFT